ncbi:MAG: anti-sigma factor [Proteobacteria bacterium]|nr:anti-sigma factor [Pseudomonadota bacterium]
MSVDEETLMRYVDGELDAEQHAALARRLASDPPLAARIAALEQQRDRLQRAYGAELSEPVPAALRAVLAAPAPAAAVADLAQRRARGAARARRWAGREWAAMAASLALGVIAAQLWSAGRAGPELALGAGGLVARGRLAAALSEQLSGEGDAGSGVRIGLSYRDRAGAFCRAFVLQGARPVSGAACRVDGSWRVGVAVASPAAGASGELRTAASELAPAVLRAVSDDIDGEPLDASAERAGRAAGWQVPAR